MSQKTANSEQGVICATLNSPVPDGTPRQRYACEVDAGSDEPATAADDGSNGGADAPRADAPGPDQERSGWRSGRPKLSERDRRTHTVSARFNPAELHHLDVLSASVGLRRGEFLRVAALESVPPTIPELNKHAWIKLSKSAANLNQLARHINENGVQSDITEISNMLAYFRQILIEVGEDYESKN